MADGATANYGWVLPEIFGSDDTWGPKYWSAFQGVDTTVYAISLATLQKANNLSDLASAATSRSNLGLGTSAIINTGTSGATIPFLNGINTWAASQTFSSAITYGGVTLSNGVTGTGSMVLSANPAFTGTLTSADHTVAGNFQHSGGIVSVLKTQSIPAGGLTSTGYMFSSATAFGVYFGSGPPTCSAAKGSLYLRSDGSGTANRAYINTDGGSTWTAVTTAI